MSPAARELALIGHEKRREPIRCKAAVMRASLGMKPHVGLALILTKGDRL